jgi:hypothetical protein
MSENIEFTPSADRIELVQNIGEPSELTQIEIEEKLAKKAKKDKKLKLENRLTQTLMRSMLANLVSLSELADNKAGIMISVNSIIISIMVTFLFSTDNFDPQLLYPVIFFLIVCMSTIIYSIFVTKPNLSSNRLEPQNFDLLFFGSMAKLSRAEYKSKMKELIQNESNLEDEILENLHAQGLVLDRKYKNLQTAYTIFLIGFPAAVVAMILTLIIK